ncbi:hypothetical protein [Comamonas thiooxydans]|uniref:hypothetical protein n=1 Tax=Comamonas thiooxydans TaxID=363952 RepID=UPI00103A9168|nr:hypothetical protein [Comamonas thiooxydans]
MEKNISAWKAQTPYPVEFTHNGSKWCLTIYAIDDEDAEAKVQSLRNSATLIGGAIEKTIEWCGD